jgi:hypothetical protein
LTLGTSSELSNSIFQSFINIVSEINNLPLNISVHQVAPNMLWQKPLVGAMPNGVDAPGRLRNVLDDPFFVRANRETLGGELLITYDPTPSTWMYEWNNDMVEDDNWFVTNLEWPEQFKLETLLEVQSFLESVGYQK